MVKVQDLTKVTAQISGEARLLPGCPETIPAACSPSLLSRQPKTSLQTYLIDTKILTVSGVCTTAAIIIRYSPQQLRDDLSLLH